MKKRTRLFDFTITKSAIVYSTNRKWNNVIQRINKPIKIYK